MVPVLHFRLRQGRLAGSAPVNGFLAPVDVPVQHELAELFHRLGLIVEIHGDVGVVPVSENSQPLELAALNVEIPVRVGPAHASFVPVGNLVALRPQFLVHLVLDGQTVAVPARHKDTVVSRHVLGLDDDVLDDLVQGRPEVNVAVGVGRSVVKDVRGPPLGNLPDFPVNVGLFPEPEGFRFLFRQVGLHGEFGLRKVQGVFVIHGRFLPSIMILNP